MQDHTQPGPDALSAYFFQIADTLQKKNPDVSRALFPIIREVTEAAAQVLTSVALTCESPVPDCQSGCSFCCHSRIHVMPLEAVLICAHVQDHFSPAELHGLKDRIHGNLALTRGMNLARRVAVKDQTPCIFLEHHACSIYAQRPLICRTWNSLNRQACETAFVCGDHKAEIPCLSAPNYVYTLARDVVESVCKGMHLETGRFELVSAMDHCLGMADAAGAWKGGTAIFDTPTSQSVDSAGEKGGKDRL